MAFEIILWLACCFEAARTSRPHTFILTGWLSGVIYLKVVPPLGKDEGAIEFSLNVYQLLRFRLT